jgi:hypothetical protein
MLGKGAQIEKRADLQLPFESGHDKIFAFNFYYLGGSPCVIRQLIRHKEELCGLDGLHGTP